MNGGAGNDTENGQAGATTSKATAATTCWPAAGASDVLSGGRGRDRIRARDGLRDRINCGRGVDTVTADRNDVVASNCEHVSR